MSDRVSLRGELANIAAFGVELAALEEKDLPLLCYWRNQPEIRPFMDDIRPVTPKVMNVWLNKARSGDTGWPYMVHMGGNPVAYTEIKNINWADSSCEDGIFLFGKAYIGTGIAYRIVLCRELVMARLGLRTLISRVRIENTRSIRFCMKYGGEYVRTEGDFLVYEYDFARRRQSLKTIARILEVAGEFERVLGEEMT